MTHLVVVTGPDGAGKSSVCKRICEMLSEPVAIVDVWQGIDQSPFRSCRDSVQDYMKDLDSRSRALLILHTLSRSFQNAMTRNPSVIIADGYWYKYAVTELALSGDETLFRLGNELFQIPHATFFLDVPPEAASKRKASFSAYESGFSSDDKTRAFVRFQSRIYDKWQTMRTLFPAWHSVDSLSHNIESAASLICSRISTR